MRCSTFLGLLLPRKELMKSMHRQDHILQSVLVCVSSPNLSLKWRRGAQKPAPQSHGASSGSGLTDPSRSAFSSLALIYIDISSLLLTGKHIRSG